VSALVEAVAPATRVVSLTDAVELNPRPDRAALSDDLEVSFVPMAAVEAGSGRMDATAVRRFGEVKKGYTVFREGDVLFAKITPCMENGKMAVARGLHNGVGCGSTEFHVLRARPGVDPHYVYHFVSSARFRAEAAHQMTGAVGQKRVPAAFLEQSEIPLPDLDEQRRIVAEIEKQFSRLDEAVANLKRVKANLKRYKAAVLKAAVEGRLVPTEADVARREGRDYETGEQLLQCILETRRRQRKGKGKEPATPETTRKPELPEGWVWATVEQVALMVEYGTSAKTNDNSSGIPVLRMGNIVEGELKFDDLKYLPTQHEEFPKLLLEPGDILFNRTNSPELVGKAAVFLGSSRPHSFASYLIRVRLIEGCLPTYLNAYINSVHGRAWIKTVVTQQVGQANVNGTKLQALPIPLPPLSEQQRIAAEVERHLSVLADTERQVERNLYQTHVTRASLLSKVFGSAR